MSVDSSISRITRGNRFSRERIDDTSNQSSASVERNKGAFFAPLFRRKPLKGKVKLILVSFGLIGIVCLVMFVYLSTCYVDPNYLNVGAYLNRSYSRDTLRNIIETEKIYLNTVEDVTKENKEKWSHSTFDPSKYASSTRKLDAEMFSTANGYIENFKEINEALLAYTSANGSFTVNDFSFDGLAYLAMCNDESYAWLRDPKQTISSAFPSTIIDIDTTDYVGQIENLNIGTIFTSSKAYGFTGGSYCNNSAWIWVQDSYHYCSDQGPSTSAFSQSDHSKVLANSTSETEILNNSKDEIEIIARDSTLLNLMLETCTGSGQPYFSSTICNNGDRWNIADSATVYAYNMQTYIPLYINKYKEMYSDDEIGKYEILCFMQMQHWFGSGYLYFTDYGTSGLSNHYAKPGAWSMLIRGVCDESSLGIIQEAVKNDILNLHGSLPVTETDSELVKKVLENVDSLNLKYTDGSVFKSSTDVISGQGRSEFINYVYNYMVLEELFSKGVETE